MDCFKIGVLGAVDSGKSTLIGVLKTNQNDDGRGLVRGQFFTREGKLVASTIQEGLIRRKKPKKAANKN